MKIALRDLHNYSTITPQLLLTFSILKSFFLSIFPFEHRPSSQIKPLIVIESCSARYIPIDGQITFKSSQIRLFPALFVAFLRFLSHKHPSQISLKLDFRRRKSICYFFFFNIINPLC